MTCPAPPRADAGLPAPGLWVVAVRLRSQSPGAEPRAAFPVARASAEKNSATAS